MHVLIIEDEPLIALELADVLQRLGYDTCDMADTAGDAVRRAEARPPDLVVSDVKLRSGNGIDAVQAIRRRVDVPVIFATASHEDIRRRIGEVSIVEKPIQQAELERAIEFVAEPVSTVGTK
jgi:DNA-binding response OmpR family regulator